MALNYTYFSENFDTSSARSTTVSVYFFSGFNWLSCSEWLEEKESFWNQFMAASLIFGTTESQNVKWFFNAISLKDMLTKAFGSGIMRVSTTTGAKVP